MKNIAPFLLFLIINLSCNNKTQYHSFITYPKLTENFTKGIWHLAIMDKKINDDYSQYSLHFNTDFTFIVSNDDNYYKGRWNVLNDKGTDDTPVSDIGMDLLFTAYAPHKLEQLGHHYHIITRTKEKIELINEDTEHPSKIVLFRT